MRNDRERLGEAREYDIFDLTEGLWRQRLLVLVVTVLVAALAVVYAMLATPVYEAKVLLQPPLSSDISQLNVGRVGGDDLLAPIREREVGQIYRRNLQSDSLRQAFFEQVYLPSLGEGLGAGSAGLYAKFYGQLQVLNANEEEGRSSVSARAEDPHQAADWVVKYAEMAGERTKSELIKKVTAEFKVEADNLQRAIDAARANASREREDRIIQLTEALHTARSIGLEKPPIITTGLSAEVSAGMNGSLMYMRGSKALESEIKNLQARVSDDPFVSNLREREQKVSFYRSVTLTPDQFEVYRQDGVVEPPEAPVKPRKALIVGLGVLVGLFIGTFIALIREAWRFRQARQN
ncbi:Wzz/FepE/Etk N-terminal domain-containing protein [Pseudomonas sp. DCB_AW]|jgi:chain length determinant protein (polysaccharide antigen chain regulator)|uniref:LPS O-antigen chain length determinant protein WzzB n=1 Tax=unclassified Pseudomonas TaxID=196821 RepID=UPI001EE06A3B|nr:MULTISPECIES: Wzz/FepE/Etk N-terminal domain-containing protein [unclassified Pseudomonas]MCX2686310.1 Wzz/FepE/Etk N-terminal domain-containing protein [Pseudomonas sp. DCB_AW]GHS82298.1 O-antigen chain length regulator [Pseudomonas sp. PAGU 2196]